MKKYYRPMIRTGKNNSENSFGLCNTSFWFDHLEVFQRGKSSYITPANKVPSEIVDNICNARKNRLLSKFPKPAIMGILNLTPDSFSDGGANSNAEVAINSAMSMTKSGANIIDIGAESTRPGSDPVEAEEEMNRLEPVLQKIEDMRLKGSWSVDTRKASVMEMAIGFGIEFINDISALSYDRKSVKILADNNSVVCLMHGGKNPKTMQTDTVYDDVLLDVYDFLEERIEHAVTFGVKKSNIFVDPGIGFKKTMQQNLTLIKNASIFHSLGCPLLFGVSRKGFLGYITGVEEPEKRVVGSIAVALELVRQGVHVIRVHDVDETKQAIAVWKAINM